MQDAFVPLSFLLVGLLWLTYVWISRGRGDEWFYSALTSIGDAILTTDAKGRVILLNEPAQKLAGWNVKDAAGRHVHEILRMVNYDTREPVENPADAVLRSGRISGWITNAILIARSGSECVVDISAAPLFGALRRVKGVTIIMRDITSRHANEQKLMESEERLRAVTNSAGIGLVMIDRERRYIYANSFYLQMLAIGNVNLIGRRVGEVLPVMYDRIRPYLDRAFAGERLSYEIKGIQKKEQGLNRTYRITYEPQLRHSLVMHVVIVVVDITDMKPADPS